MAQQSRNQRHKARQRRNVSLLSRQIREMQAAHLQTHLSLLAVLAQSGGQVTVTKGTFTQVIQGVRTLNWQRVASEVEGETIIRLVEPVAAPEEGTEVASNKVQLTRLPDEDEAILADQDTEAAADESLAAEDSIEGAE